MKIYCKIRNTIHFFRLRMLAVWSNDGEFKILTELPEIMTRPKVDKPIENEAGY